jgi:hypothetical protein
MTTVNESMIKDVLKRLGFFYVQEVDRETVSDFQVGHVASVPFLAVSRTKATGGLSGPYAELVERLGPVVSRYIAESDEIVMLSSDARQIWIAELANQAEITIGELKSVISGGR